MAVIRLHQNIDRETVTLSDEARSDLAIELDVAQIDRLLQALGDMRARMQPKIAPDWQPGRSVQAVTNPRFSAEVPPDEDFTVLHLRDPRFGWLHYSLPSAECGKLAQFLARAAQRVFQPSQPPST
jgi:hypothetical protein